MCESCSAGEKLLQAKPPWARYHAVNWDATNRVLKDSSGNNRSSVLAVGTLAYASASGSGAQVAQQYIHGGPTSSIRLPLGSVPSAFTICSMTRYTGTAKGRIINAFGGNFAHGHDGGAGVAYYGDLEGWSTSRTGVGSAQELHWLVMCGKSSGKQPGNVLTNGQAVGVRDMTISSNLQMAINAGDYGSGSDFAFAHAIVWDYILSDEEMATVSYLMMQSLNDASINIAAMGVCTRLDPQSVLWASPPWARYHAVNWDPITKTLLDSSGNNRHSVQTRGTVLTESKSGNGSTVPQTYIYGDTDSRIYFPSGSIPKYFTLCVTARYNSGVTARQNRIFTSDPQNFVHGHWSNKRGVAYYGQNAAAWVTDQYQVSASPAGDWLVMCGKNPGTAPNNILRHGEPRGIKDTAFEANWTLTINTGLVGGEYSDWAVAHAIVWDKALTDAEMSQVSRDMINSLTNASIQVSSIGNKGVVLAACSGGSGRLPCPACMPCTAGRFAAPACNGQCLECPYGTYSAVVAAPACMACGTGTYSAVMGATACVACVQGTYAPYVGMSSCVLMVCILVY